MHPATESRAMKNQHINPIVSVLMVAALLLLVSCSEDRTTSSYETHPSGWNQPGSADFHGPQSHLSSSNSCAVCHGEDFSGGQSGVSCYTCHAGYPHVGFQLTPGVHRTSIRESNWNLTGCQQCHGTNFAGGSSGVSCLGCHDEQGGPVACNTCHANPPVDDAGLPSGMVSGSYGAHAKHAVEKGYACTECHNPAAGFSHAGALPAEVTFDYARIANRPPYQTAYTHLGDNFSGNGTCATYCHSDGRGASPLINPGQWVGGSLNQCQSCHAVPPASANHPSEPSCHLCHPNIDPASNYSSPDGILFIDPSTHVNGVVNIAINP